MTTSLRTLLSAVAATAMLVLNASPAAPKSVSDFTARDFSAHFSLYPYTFNEAPALTASPEGYVPFHIEHYGRHGARWLIDRKDYNQPLQELEKAERNGMLTPLGRETLDLMRELSEKGAGRLEELTDAGALQHQGIGERMVRNFPQVFAPGSVVNARSTVVIRCILSMANELNSISRLAPDARVISDASQADMYYMNFYDEAGAKFRESVKKTKLKKYTAGYPETGACFNRLISDPQFIKDSLNTKGLERRLWRCLSNTQSHIGMPWLTDRVFTHDELHAQWLRSNASWFVDAGNSKINNYAGAFSQRNLLRNIIESSDTALVSPGVSANLRFGHDGMVLPLTVLMELNDYGREINSFEDIEKAGWYCQDVVPMAGNIQMIFYRPIGSTDPDDVLVKVLLNENETELPGQPVTGPYYSWKALRKYYLDKLDSFREQQP